MNQSRSPQTSPLFTATVNRLRGAAISEDRIAVLIDRAVELVECLASLADLDPDLPEPALTWNPPSETSQ